MSSAGRYALLPACLATTLIPLAGHGVKLQPGGRTYPAARLGRLSAVTGDSFVMESRALGVGR